MRAEPSPIANWQKHSSARSPATRTSHHSCQRTPSVQSWGWPTAASSPAHDTIHRHHRCSCQSRPSEGYNLLSLSIPLAAQGAPWGRHAHRFLTAFRRRPPAIVAAAARPPFSDPVAEPFFGVTVPLPGASDPVVEPSSLSYASTPSVWAPPGPDADAPFFVTFL